MEVYHFSKAEEEKIVNPNCLCAVLLNHIRKVCNLESIPENLDLASESGDVVDLVSKPKEYAKKYLEPRTVYILVKVIGDDTDDSNFTYVPMLDSAQDKIKFSGIIYLTVTNPTFRQRAKVKGKGDLIKEKILEDSPVMKTKASGVNKVADKDTLVALEKKMSQYQKAERGNQRNQRLADLRDSKV
jgi:hypothetical protein